MKEKNMSEAAIIEGIGYICLDFVRGRDIWGNWHEETYYCHAETTDGTVDLGSLIGAALDAAPACARDMHGTECDEDDRDGCPHLDNRGACRPKLVKFKITVETEPLTEPEQIEKWWLAKSPPENTLEESQDLETTTREPMPLELFEDCREKLRNELNMSQNALQNLKELVAACQGKRMHWNKSGAQVFASCTYIVTNYEQSTIKKSQIADVLQIDPETVDAHCDEICSSLGLPLISSKELMEKELKQHAFELRRLVNQGKSFYYISDSLNIEPKRLQRYLRRLGLKCESLGWGLSERK